MSQLFYEISFNQYLRGRKDDLIKERREIDESLAKQSRECDHISVCLGYDGPYQYRDTSICECLLCREENPQSKYPTIDATYYRQHLYSHGEFPTFAEDRMKELQDTALDMLITRPNLTTEELIEEINKEIAEEAKTHKPVDTTPVVKELKG